MKESRQDGTVLKHAFLVMPVLLVGSDKNTREYTDEQRIVI